VTGLSGSRKSSLAFDTTFAEGQRRYVESLSSYARQCLGQMDKPDVDFIEGLSPAVSIDQKSTSRNPRSTVGTITEVYDYLRLLFARAGRPHCPVCGEPVTRQTPQQIVDRLLELPEGTRFQVLAPVVRARKGEYADRFREKMACPNDHPLAMDEIEPRSFSFNSPFGACPECTGLGTRLEVDPDLLVPDDELTLAEGAIAPWTQGSADYFQRLMKALGD